MSSPVSYLTFVAGYDLERKIEDFLATRSSALAAGCAQASQLLDVTLVGLASSDPRVSTLRAAAGPLRLRLHFEPARGLRAATA